MIPALYADAASRKFNHVLTLRIDATFSCLLELLAFHRFLSDLDATSCNGRTTYYYATELYS